MRPAVTKEDGRSVERESGRREWRYLNGDRVLDSHVLLSWLCLRSMGLVAYDSDSDSDEESRAKEGVPAKVASPPKAVARSRKRALPSLPETYAAGESSS